MEGSEEEASGEEETLFDFDENPNDLSGSCEWMRDRVRLENESEMYSDSEE
jgi:hypothetical protein